MWVLIGSLGFFASHEVDEPVEQHKDVVGARTGFGVALKAEGGTIGELEALERPVEQRDVSDPRIVGKAVTINGEAMVLAGDEYAPAIEVLNRVVSAVMAGLHFDRATAQRDPQNLLPKTDAK